MTDSIQGLIDRNIIILNQNTSVQDAARAMDDKSVGCILVSSEQHIVGIVTDRDLAIEVLAFDQPADLPLSRVMNVDLVVVDRAATIPEVLKVMEVNGVRRVPVLDHTLRGIEKCIGLITLDDLLAIQAAPLDQVSRIVKTQMMRRLRLHKKQHVEKENREQTLSHFYKTLADEMEMPQPQAERIVYFLLKEFLQKVPATNATHFISQLPSLIRSDMMNIPAGPHRHHKAKSMLEDLKVGFQMDEQEAIELILKFWSGLRKALNPEIVHYIQVILPHDFRDLVEIEAGAESLKTGVRRQAVEQRT